MLGWEGAEGGAYHRRVDGTMAFVDISGFTAMSERLARLGKEGAEEVAEIINSIFARLLAVAYENGGSLLKFGGDALLLFFEGDQHATRAAHAAAWMRRRLREIGRIQTSAGLATLKMHVGLHSGGFDFFVVGDVHRELIVTGPAATTTVTMESSAVAGEILMSEATASFLPPGVLGDARNGGRLLVRTPPPPLVWVGVPTPDVDPSPFIAPPILEHVSAPVDPEHRRVAVSFVRFEGVDELVQSQGTEAAAEQLDILVRTVQRAAQEQLVTFLDSDPERDGGKLMLAAGAPWSTERDGEQLLRAVRAVVESAPPLPLRIGVNQGHVFTGLIGPSYRRKYSVMGDAVNLTARLMAKAEPGQIVATPEVVEGSRTLFDVVELEPFTVKGKAHPIRACVVGPAVGTQSTDLVSHTPMLGRERELALLLGALAEARAGRGRVVEIAAEPGMGKSRLVEELRWQAGEERVLSVGAEPYSASVAYFLVDALVRQALGLPKHLRGPEAGAALERSVRDFAPQLLPWLPLVAVAVNAEVEPTPETAALDEAFKADRLHRVVADLLHVALPTAALVVVEDAHWADPASEAFLEHLARTVAGRPWLVLVTRRPEGRSLLSDPSVPGQVVELEALGEDASLELVRSLAKRVAVPRHELARVIERAAGNPLFLQELASALRTEEAIDTLPTTVEAVIGARIDRLAPSERSLLRRAAVLGTAFDAELLRAVVGPESVPAIEDLERRLEGFVVPEGMGRFRFHHALIRDVAYEGLPFRRRRELHRRVGETLEARAGAAVEDVCEVLSLHFERAGLHAKAWRYAVMAGDRARERFATVQAAEFYERALGAVRRLPEIPPEQRRHVGEALGDAYERTGRYARAANGYRLARSVAAPGSVDLTRLFWKEGVVRLRMGRYPEALRWYRRGLSIDPSVEGVVPIRVELGLGYAGVRYYQGRYRDCIAWCRKVLPEAMESGDLGALAHAYSLLHLAYTHLGSEERAAFRGLALPLYEELGDLTRQGHVLNNMGIESYYDGEWDAAVELYERGQQALEKAGGVVDAADVTYNIAEIFSDQGRLDEAEKLTREILETYRAARYPVGEALAIGNLGRIASRAGRFTEAAELLEDALQRFTDLGDERFTLEMECRLVELCVFMMAPDEALRRVGGVLERIRKIGNVPALLSMVRRLEGYALAQSGDPDAARDRIRESIRVARESKTPYEVALSLQALATIPDGWLPGEVEPARSESNEILDRLSVLATPRVPLS